MDASPTLWTLTLTAAGLGVLHTVTGPDHYIPFIAMSRVGRWSVAKTLMVTLLCGLGHVAGSVLLGPSVPRPSPDPGVRGAVGQVAMRCDGRNRRCVAT